MWHVLAANRGRAEGHALARLWRDRVPGLFYSYDPRSYSLFSDRMTVINGIVDRRSSYRSRDELCGSTPGLGPLLVQLQCFRADGVLMMQSDRVRARW